MKFKVKGLERQVLTPTLIYLWLIMFLIEVVKSALLVTILPVYMGSVLGLSAFAIGWSLSLQYIGDNFFRSPAGWLVERIGFRLTMLAGLALALGAVALIAWGRQAGVIAAACTLLGIGTAPLWPSVLVGISDMNEGKQNFGTAMGIIQMSTLGGTGAGPVIINLFIHQSYSSVFWILLACLAAAMLFALLLPGSARTPRTQRTQKTPRTPHGQKASRLRTLISHFSSTFSMVRNSLHVSRLLYPALFLQSFAVGLLTPIITLYIRTVLGLSPGMFSVLLVTGGAVTVLGLIPVGKLVDKHGTRIFLNIGFSLACLSILGLALFRDLAAVWILVIGAGLSYAFILPTWDTMIAGQLPKGEKGTVWGLFLTIQGTGMVAGPIVSGKLWDVYGPSAPFLVSAASMGALLLIHLWISRPAPPAAAETGTTEIHKPAHAPVKRKSGPKARVR
ncbi:MFS transporter [Paenibacillus pinistramenti]|uniref:MFS transporter n=1 Tax=Paenibacillus pinistramenti TaxID=1768003 RepID=UPI0011091D23|nr:MFS transporter [Paenibacillus pinistramenti]